MSLRNIPISRTISFPTYGFPIRDREIYSVLRKLNGDVKGLSGVEITTPRKNEEFGFMGKYDPNKRIIFLYAHLKNNGVYIVGHSEVEVSSAKLKRRILEEIVLHEVGHHVGWTRHRDLSERFAKDYVRRVKKIMRGKK